MRPVLAVLLFLSTYTFVRPRNQEQVTAVCMGEYSQIKPGSNGTTRSSPQDRWRMYSMPEGNYIVEVQRLPLSEPFRVDERHRFSKAMEPLSADIALHLGAKIHCDYQSSEIACTIAGPDGTSISSRLRQLKPYVFAPASLPLADTPWLAQMVAVQANSTADSITTMPLITMLNDENGKDEDKLTVQDSVHIESLGFETIDLLNQRVSALKLRMRDSVATHSEDSEYLWMSNSGLLLQITSGNQVVTTLSSYQGPQL
jgi:hypothetical protein